MAELVYDRPSYWYYPTSFVGRVINTVIGLVEFMLALRLILEILGASASAPFVAWVYGVTQGIVAPFAGAFPSWNIGGFILDLSTIFAMIGVAIIGWLLMRLLGFFALL